MKVVITAAGKGTRLLPVTKKIPKEMLPIFQINNNQIRAVPMLQIIFEQLLSCKIRDFCFVVGREKQIIKDHFTINHEFLKLLDSSGKKLVTNFYQKLNKSNITWINQRQPKGFGDAVRASKTFVGNDNFIVHGGDVSIFSKNIHPVTRLIHTSTQNPDASAILLCKKVKDTSRYGVPKISKISKNLFEVHEVEEKPTKPKSNFALMPIYFFKPEIISSLKNINLGKCNEYQLTDAIQHLLENNKKVLAIPMFSNELELDVGTADSYKSALNLSSK